MKPKKRKAPSKSSKEQVTRAPSMGNAASIMGVSVALLKKAKRAGSTGFLSNGTVMIPDVRAWLEENEDLIESSDEGSTEAVNKERIILMRKQQRKADMEYEVAMGNLVSIESVKSDTAKLMTALTGILKKTLSRADYNAVATQFQQVDYQNQK